MTRATRVMVSVAIAAALAGCDDADLRTPPPALDLDGEAAVVAKIGAAHAALTADPSFDRWVAYARILHAHGLREATDAYDVAIPAAPKDRAFEVLYLAGHSCFKSDPDRALAYFERAAAVRDDDFTLQVRMATLHERAGRLAKARHHFARAQAIEGSSIALAGLGRVALAEGKVDEAIATLEKARALRPDHAEVHVALAQAYLRAGRKSDAARASALAGDVEREYPLPDPLAAVVAREGVSVASLLEFATAALRGGQFGQALDAIDRALSVDPTRSSLRLLRAQALVGLGRFADAEPILDGVLAESPADATALAFRGGCAIARQDLTGAASYLRRAVAANPALVDAHGNLANVLLALGQASEARKHASIVVDRAPHRADARLVLAQLDAAEGRTGDAFAQIEVVLGREPSNARALELKRRLQGR